MPDDEEYELTPHSEIKKLKEEVERLKKNPLGHGRSAKDLLDSVDNLNKSINDLINIFKDVADGMKTESTSSGEGLSDSATSKIDRMADENEKIAEGILSLADLIKENIESQKELALRLEKRESPRPLREPLNVFSAPGPQPIAPPMQPAPSYGLGPMPPPGIGPMGPPSTPPLEVRKHGLFDKLRK